MLFLVSVPAARNSLGTFLMFVIGGPPVFGGGGMPERIRTSLRSEPARCRLAARAVMRTSARALLFVLAPVIPPTVNTRVQGGLDG